MKKSAITVLLGDPTMADPAKPNAQFTAEDLDAVAYLHDALAELAAFTFSYLNDHRQLLRRLIDAPPAFVLNFCDNGYQNHAGFEPHLTALLDMLGIPYSGSGPTALTLCYDKALVRALAASVGVPVPIETYGTAANISLTAVDYPAFIKPNSADGSVGIGERSLVHDATEARAYCVETGWTEARSFTACAISIEAWALSWAL